MNKPKKSIIVAIKEAEDELTNLLQANLPIEVYDEVFNHIDKILALNLLAITLENSI